MTESSEHRLPRTVEPVRYALEIAPDLDGFVFDGTARVTVVVHEPTAEVVMNAAELDIKEATVTPAGGSPVGARLALDEENERVVIGLDTALSPGEHVVELRYTGVINDMLRGFYRSTFRTDDGTEAVIAATQFEATDARRAFPCFDEPDRKAVFAVTLVVPPDMEAFSNTSEVERRTVEGGRVAVRFADTMKMSTYLVAFVVGPLGVTDPVDVDGVPLRIVHAPGKGHLCGFALEVGAHALRYFSSWFGIPYPGDKLDLIALPDFAFGAMENVGAVTFRESLLLIDRDASSHVELERVADVIAHEIAHMWFGDLVTMSWWNGLWLNEAFATFMELLCVDSYRPDWDRWVTFGLSRGAAMTIDGLPSTRPIEFPVHRPEDAEGMFDALTYQKGAGVLRMLERYLGEEPFRRGIHHYLRGHLYGNADTTDLWDAIEEATGEPVRSTMDSWIFQPGHPLVTVEPTDRGLALRQERFSYLGEDDGTRWSVPVLVRAGIGGDVVDSRILLTGDAGEVDLGGRPEWAVVNAGGWGFYRVGYSGELFAALGGDLTKLDAMERFNLLSDTWAGVLAGRVGVGQYRTLCAALGPDDDPAVWSMALGACDFLHRVVADEGRPVVEAFVRATAGPALAALGTERRDGDSDKTRTLRGLLMSALGTIGADEGIRRLCLDLHRASLTDPRAVDPDLAQTVVSVVAWSGDRREYDEFLERFHHPANPQEEVRYLYALGAFRSLDMVERTMSMSLGEVRSQNAPFLVSALLANRVGGPAAWRYLRGNWDRVLERIPQNSIVRLLEGLSALCTTDLAPEIRRFFADHPLRSGQRTLEQILDRLDVNSAFARRERDSIAAALSA
ncbi:MAG TPA: M1 family metallopeptidase [Acidimicrobiales bacterium]|nr:M1 family metallopeptidase [Acidimicrobiales bacterium]